MILIQKDFFGSRYEKKREKEKERKRETERYLYKEREKDREEINRKKGWKEIERKNKIWEIKFVY